LYRFYQILNAKNASLPGDLSGADRAIAQARQVLPSFAAMYGEIFTITAIVCVVGALLGLLVSGRKEHADEPEVPEEQVVALGER
jgi:MFS transporter, DHA2 family, triacylglyceride efflux pump